MDWLWKYVFWAPEFDPIVPRGFNRAVFKDLICPIAFKEIHRRKFAKALRAITGGWLLQKWDDGVVARPNFSRLFSNRLPTVEKDFEWKWGAPPGYTPMDFYLYWHEGIGNNREIPPNIDPNFSFVNEYFGHATRL